MPNTTNEAGMAGYTFPEAEPVPSAPVERDGVVDPSRTAASYGGMSEQEQLRMECLRYACETHAGQSNAMIIEVAQKYHDFIKGVVAPDAE